MIDLKNKIEPDIIFMPSLTDIHQDHTCVAQEGLRAFKTKTIFSYELPWNNLNFQTSGFIKVSEKNINKKSRPYLNMKLKALDNILIQNILNLYLQHEEFRLDVNMRKLLSCKNSYMKSNHKNITFFGCKTTTLECMQGVLDDGYKIDSIVSLSPEQGEQNQVSGYCNLEDFAKKHSIKLIIPDHYSLKVKRRSRSTKTM